MKSVASILRALLALTLLAVPVLAIHAQMNDLAINKAKEFINLLNKGDFETAYGRVDSNLGFKINAEKLGSVWRNLVSKAGSLQEFKEAKVDSVSGYIVVTQVVKFERGHVDIKVALDNSMRVADFRFLNHESPKAQAQAQPPSAGAAQAEAPAASSAN
jgi:hypothetical protein